ncbi:MAG: SUMF1/EgtB/PvdO family nonheme iron enzyme [Deltaproteobacteria bacterium]|nr:SUMF1/EgtB/PvdO family nonheme iron enzyme [Deltaproteobacteria bacterium]
MIFFILFSLITSAVPDHLAQGFNSGLNSNNCPLTLFYYGRLKKTGYKFTEKNISFVTSCIKTVFPVQFRPPQKKSGSLSFFTMFKGYRISKDYFATIPSGYYHLGYIPNLRRLAKKLASSAGTTISQKDFIFSRWEKLDSFLIMTREVSIKEYKSGKLGISGKSVSGITYTAARNFCKKLGGDLPDELQFETAARGGEYYRPWSWGESIPTDCFGKMTGCTSKEKIDVSIWGVWNLSSSLSEWVKPTASRGVPSGKVIFKGGTTKSHWFYNLVANRYLALSDHTSRDIGFRCVFPVVSKP